MRKVKIILLSMVCLLFFAGCQESQQNQGTMTTDMSREKQGSEKEKIESREGTQVTEEKAIEEKVLEETVREESDKKIVTPQILRLQDYQEEMNWESYKKEQEPWWAWPRLYNGDSSSELREETGVKLILHSAERVLDFDTTTAWIEGVEGQGINEVLEIKIDDIGDCELVAVDILNGFCKSEKLWSENSRVKALEVIKDEEIVAILSLEDHMDIQRFYLPKPITKGSTTIKFRIKEVYQGSQYEDTAISEIHFVGSGKDKSVGYIDKGSYEVTMTLEDGTKGIIEKVADKNLSFKVAFSKNPVKASVEEQIKKEFQRNQKTKCSWTWLNDRCIAVSVIDIEPGEYYSLLFQKSYDEAGITYNPTQYWLDSENQIKAFAQNQVISIDIQGDEIGEVEIVDLQFPSTYLEANSLSPKGDAFLYEKYPGLDFREMFIYKPVVYSPKKGFVEVKSEGAYNAYDGEYPAWLPKEKIYIAKGVFDLDGRQTKTMDLDGFIASVATSPHQDQVAVFAGEMYKPLKLYMYDEDMEQVLWEKEMPFTYTYFGDCNRKHKQPLYYQWKDQRYLYTEGWTVGEESDNMFATYEYGEPSVYRINVDVGDVEKIADKARLLGVLDNGKLIIEYYATKDEKQPREWSSETFIVDQVTGEKTKLELKKNSDYRRKIFTTYQEKIFSIYEGILYSYNIETGEYETMEIGNNAKILGVRDGHLIINRDCIENN